MSASNSQLIAFTEIASQIDKTKPTRERILEAMKLIQNHWLITNEAERQMTAIAVGAEHATEEEKAIIKEELDFHRALNAGGNGVPIDFSTLIESQTYGGDKWFKLNILWEEATKPKEPTGGFVQ